MEATDLKWHLSGGADNVDPNQSLGGAISNTEVADGVDENIFDDVSAAEAEAGDTEYRCVYVKNTNATDTLYNAQVWIDQQTPAGDEVQIALDPAGVGDGSTSGVAESVADEGTPPQLAVNDEVIGTGDGATTTFSATLKYRPVKAGSVTVTDGVETFTDNGDGTLTGDQGGSGTVNYDTGEISVTFANAPASGAQILADYKHEFSAADSTKPLSIGDIGPGQCQAIWIKRIVPAGCAKYAGNSFTLKIQGEAT